MAIFGLIGYPLEHSFSPKYMNRLFRKKEMPHYYEAFPLREEDVRVFISYINLFKIKGLNITIPYKSVIIPYLDEVSEDVEIMNACNVIDVKDKRLIGHNTDWYGFSRALEIEKIDVKKKKVLIFGSGGAAKSIFYALSKNDVGSVVFVARRPEVVIEIVETIGDRYPVRVKITKWDMKDEFINTVKEVVEDSDIIINTTPLGMYPHIDNMPPLPDIDLKGKVFFDVVYNPQITKFLQFAEERGAKIVNGIGMLMYQGSKALSIWLDRDFEKDVEEIFAEFKLIDRGIV